MKSLQAWFSGLAALGFLFVSAPVQVQAGGTTSGASTSSATFNGIANVLQEYNTTPATFGSNPMQPQFSPTAQMLQQSLAQCAVSAGLTGDDLTDSSISGAASLSSAVSLVNQLGKKGGKANSSTKGPQDCGDNPVSFADKNICSVNCKLPASLRHYSCTGDTSKQTEQLNNYIDYLTAKEGCGNKDYEKLLKQQKVMDCEVQQLQNAMNSASQQINAALQNNQIVFQKMQTTMQQMGSQYGQIVALVGSPDGKSTGKFQTLQDELKKSIDTLQSNKSDFQNKANDIKTRTSQNEAFLQSSKTSQLGQCMGLASDSSSTDGKSTTSSSTAKATMMCHAITGKYDAAGCPVTTSAAVPCSPIQAAQSAILGSYIGRLKSTSRCTSANAALGQLSAGQNDLLSKLNNQGTWQDLSSQLSGYVSQYSNPNARVNLSSQFSALAQYCGKAVDQWAKDAQNPNKAHSGDAATYFGEKVKIQNDTNTLSSTIDANMYKANDEISRIYAALSNNNTLSPDTVSCTHTNPDTMQSCYSTIVQSLVNMSTGTGGWPAGTPTVLTGGSQWPNMVIPCQGLTDCTNKYTQARDALGKQMQSTSQLAQQYVQNGNNQVQSQVSSYAQSLMGIQQMIAAQYAAMKQTMGDMGARSPGALKTISCENLKPSKVGNAAGPYENPQNISAVFSCQVSGGLVDFTNLGIDDAISDAKRVADRKKDSLDDQIEKLSDTAQKIADCSKEQSGLASNLTKDCHAALSGIKSRQSDISALGNAGTWVSEIYRVTLQSIEKGDEGSLNTLSNARETLSSQNDQGLLRVSDQIDLCLTDSDSYSKINNNTTESSNDVGSALRARSKP